MYILSILKFNVKYLFNVLCPYYKFIYPGYFILHLKIITNEFYSLIIFCYIFLLITCNRKLIFIFLLKFHNNMFWLQNDNDDVDDINMIGKYDIITKIIIIIIIK